MKNYRSLSVAALISLIAASCTMTEIASEQEVQEQNPDQVKISVTAGIETTKAETQSDGKVFWSAGDQIAVWIGETKYTLTLSSGAGTQTASFEGPAEAGDIAAAVYPASCAGTAVGSYTPKASQVIAAGSTCDTQALLMVDSDGTSTGSLSFQNITGGVRVTVPAETEKIMFLSAAGNATATVTGAGTYDIFLPVATHDGFSVVTVKDGGRYVKSSVKTLGITRSKIWNLGDVCTTGSYVPDNLSTAANVRDWAGIAQTYTADETVTLDADIDLGGSDWVPAKQFLGTFDGQGHSIYNIVCRSSADNTAFISTLGNGSGNGVVRNLVVGSSDGENYDGTSVFELTTASASGYKYVGAIGYAHAGSTLTNVTNFAEIIVGAASHVEHRAGGVSGTLKANVTMTGCKNYGNVTDNQDGTAYSPNSTTLSIGGLTGAIDGANTTVTNCENHGAVLNNCPYVAHVGGLIGVIGYLGTVSDCLNTGSVSNNSGPLSSVTEKGYFTRVGGITAAVYNNGTGTQVIKCRNTGTIAQTKDFTNTGNHTALGGVIGCVAKAATVKGCSNSGVVAPTVNITNGMICGGVVGYVTGSALTMDKASDGTWNENTGNISMNVNLASGGYIGGVVGNANYDGCNISYCRNSATVETTSKITAKKTYNIGGILGGAKGQISNCECTSTAKITASANGSTNNNGQTFYVGGIVGGKLAFSSVSDCTFSGTAKIGKGAKEKMWLGGICAYLDVNSQTISNCTVDGILTPTRSNTMFVGGLIGQCAVNTSAADKTIAEGCVLDYDEYATQAVWGADDESSGFEAGFVIGGFTGSASGRIVVGSTSSPVSVSGKIWRYVSADDKSEIATISESNMYQYAAGGKYTHADYTSTHSAAVTPNVKFNLTCPE